jgi:hypothetical protein
VNLFFPNKTVQKLSPLIQLDPCIDELIAIVKMRLERFRVVIPKSNRFHLFEFCKVRRGLFHPQAIAEGAAA